jgi:4'-phosphopantetheinyl transferase
MISSGTAAGERLETFNSSWKLPPEELVLRNDEVHLWLVSINSGDVYGLENIISNDELARAARFRLSQHRTEYVASRIHLRTILGKYTGISPQLLGFEYNEYGKPSIADETTGNLKFNFSHSSGFALYAITRSSEIGVDLELINSSNIDGEMAAKLLTNSELKRFNSLNSAARAEFFYKCWTCKEAYSKAVGKGLIINPAKIETIYSAVESVCKLETDKVFQKTSNWTFFDLPPITGYVAGAVVEGINKTKLKCLRIPERKRMC